MTTASVAQTEPARDGRDYEEDFFAWTMAQAALLRAGRVDQADLENIAEEIESLGLRDRRTVISYIRTILEHLMKLHASPAIDPRNGWMETVDRSRRELELVLNDSPSLRRLVPEIIAKEIPRARRLVGRELARYGEKTKDLSDFTADEPSVLGTD